MKGQGLLWNKKMKKANFMHIEWKNRIYLPIMLKKEGKP